ncbi:uncharacterized protein F4807DRAFT_469128 [Annulohypoxylon truncatum]|uniref:uncharacterized protein n=1 Tax=Annulohypoxylon truncatum TaxID=327061 RepID=UPI002008C078|nr:uncharacterized protein F4807DRAFT_469128 [Annulohypoxylon truncatum]KAI1207606.1 hypothetical protein F4807DRAFT_469128 [Annulohypoxylon truncatum]
METTQGTRPTPQSLPRLIIPSNRYEPEPEEITTRRVASFLDFCAKYKKAPLTRLPSIPLISPPPASDSESDTDATKCKTKNKNRQGTEDGIASLRFDNPPNTLAFTENEWEVLETKQAEYEHAKAQHTEAILEMQADPKDRKILQKCKHWRQIRERLNLEMSLIWEKREIRRNFRRDANNPKGIKNW